jgi:hypothetical protein
MARGEKMIYRARRIDHAVVAGAIACFALAWTASLYAQFLPVPGREYREIFNATNQVRGEAVVALVVAPTDESQQTDTIRVLLPKAYSGEVQVEVLSADGRFRGEGSFAGSRGDDQWVALRLGRSDTSEAPVNPRRPVSAETLALAVRGADGTLYVARWGGGTPSSTGSERLRMYVNSGRADVFIVPGERKAVRCRSLTIPQPLRYDSFCDVPIADVPDDGRFKLIRRDQFDQQTQMFSVYLPHK